MRILFNSKLTEYKDPFGVLTEDESCRLRLDIPREVGALRAEVVLEEAGTDHILTFPMNLAGEIGEYQYFKGKIRLPRGLYFYYFRIYKPNGSFRLFKQGDDTNMEAGDRWQVSAIPKDAVVPEWAKGAVIYQIYPDRFYKAGECDLTARSNPTPSMKTGANCRIGSPMSMARSRTATSLAEISAEFRKNCLISRNWVWILSI